MNQHLFRQSFGEGDLTLLSTVRRELEATPKFVLWLQGDMGAGKTSFVRHYLYALGLSERTPVVSPTYTIMNEYRVDQEWFAHLDLYRADEHFSLQELGVHDARNYRGLFVEWPEQAGPRQVLQSTHRLAIEPDGMDRRIYTFTKL